MAILNLVFYVLLIVFMCSAVSGIVMFFVDMVRFGTPHKRFECISSLEKYNEHLAEIGDLTEEIEVKSEDAVADEQPKNVPDFEIDL